jgi:hypothetical protein
LKYDESKDPSLWLFCNSDQPLQEESCGLSCHLECAFQDERSGILQNGQSKKLDGCYYCTHCGKQNDLLGYFLKHFSVTVLCILMSKHISVHVLVSHLVASVLFLQISTMIH